MRPAYPVDVSARANRLASEPSLYLRQHATNPVDWFPWGREAFERAGREDKPILLSVGYSSCHWCHVMERECFENEAIARLMNELFVCIKVDREERPDVDAIYMKALQMMTGRGGWPMTVFLTPRGKPYYAGTYFPPEDRGGMPGFPRVLVAAARAYRDERERVEEAAERVASLLASSPKPQGGGAEITLDALERAAAQLAELMDAEHGGFGRAPKFPGSLCLEFLLALDAVRPNAERRVLVRTALDRMADGGIYDHVGGGFHRYSVDRIWLVPHFEKMLYDQALLAGLYTDAWVVFDESRYAETAEGILDFVVREMTTDEGGFAAAEDADSEGEEGKYYLWTPEEVRRAVGDADAELVCRFFDVTEEGNFEGRNILRRTLTIEQAARLFDRKPEEVRAAITRARSCMYEQRRKRPAPATDFKVLSDWNGLMIGAMASSGRRLARADLIAHAARAADFIRDRMFARAALFHLYAEGERRVPGMLDDYAFFGSGCLALYLAAGRRADLECALLCARRILEAFFDEESGTFYLTSADTNDLIARPCEPYDGPVPAGGSVAIDLFLRLHSLTGEARFARAAEVGLRAQFSQALENPYGAGRLLTVAECYRRGHATVAIVADAAPVLEEWLCAAFRAYRPEASILAVSTAGVAEEDLPPALRGKYTRGDRPVAYVCRSGACGAPIEDPEALVRVLQSSQLS